MNTVPLWVTLIGFVAPLLTLAGSAVAYVARLYQDSDEKRRNHFFQLMSFIDDSKGPIATKVAAVYQLTQFPEHKEFIIRFCKEQRSNVKGEASASLIAELDCTLEAMRLLG